MPPAVYSSDQFPLIFVQSWKQLLNAHREEQRHDFPNNHVGDIDSLITTSIPRALYIGTGLSIYERALLPAILNAKHSVQLITCYWASSPSLNAIHQTLLDLVTSRSQSGSKDPLRMTIGFSSNGLFQKLLHTSSRDGYVYPPAKWPSLGLPDENTLKAGGIELTVKSLFFTPFSVMHPKFVIVDGARAWIPSCNVSWERWFEGCIEVEGDIVKRLTNFYNRVWEPEHGTSIKARRTEEATRIATNGIGNAPVLTENGNRTRGDIDNDDVTSATQALQMLDDKPVPTIFLPSSHHRNPRFSFFPFLSQANPPMTPLNAALLTLFADAQQSITILTPNVTSGPVVDALLDALARGVNVQIRTSKNMMLIEQLVTAGTTTGWCLNRLIKKYKALLNQRRLSDAEAQSIPPGRLDVFYYKSLQSRQDFEDEPVVSHFKMTLVDGEYLVLGSGNMDRASWWTSQEIGLLFYMPGFEGHKLWESVLNERTEVLFQSEASLS